MERVGWRDEGREREIRTKRERKKEGSKRDLEEFLIVFP